MSISRVKRELGLLSRDQSAPSGYNGRWAAFGNLFGCRLTEWSTIGSLLQMLPKCWTKRFHPEWLQSQMAEYNRWLTPNEGDLTRWDANHVFLLLLFSVSSRFKTENRKLWSDESNGGRQWDEEHHRSDTKCWRVGRPPVRKRSLNVLLWRKNLCM